MSILAASSFPSQRSETTKVGVSVAAQSVVPARWAFRQHAATELGVLVRAATEVGVLVRFGGEKNSGLGRFGGEWSICEFTTDH
jgi:acyl-CoA reductase-like NAD-dependent aldehyde dehydrogenase